MTELPEADGRVDERTRKRFARRQRARRWRTWRVVLATVLLLGMTALAVWLVFFSAVLAVQRVSVQGTDLLSDEEVKDVADIPEGRPLVRVDLERAERRVSALAPVGSVSVTREWPDEVLVRVRERTSVAVVEMGSRTRGLDAEGVVFRDYEEAPGDLPRVRLVGDPGREALREAASVAAALPEDLAPRVAYVSVQTVDQIVLVLRNDTEVVWGSAEESDRKSEVLLALLEATSAQRYDVSVPGQPVTSG